MLTGLRAATLDYVLIPLAQLSGVTKRKEKVRFAEQAWIVIYNSVFWLLGMYVMYSHTHWCNLRELWTGWPNRELEGSMKWYYLVQFSFWLQQIVIVNIEKRRKDYWQMLAHHVTTCILMFTSYGYHQTKVGNLIMCLMDVVDIFLAFAKILKYVHFQHVLYLMVVYSAYHHFPEETTYGCYSGGMNNLQGPFDIPDSYHHLIEPFLDPEGLVCFNDNIQLAFIYALLALQILLLLWFAMIIRVAVKVLRGGKAEDLRSDDEEEEGEEKDEGEDYAVKLWQHSGRSQEEPIELPPLEEDVGVEAINLSSHRSSPVRRFRKGAGVASGVRLHSDRKELLGRIGCDGHGD
ncbi:MAG: hypothetical protein Q9163_005277 [Psora crenata]